MAQAVAYFTGFETGDASELNSLASGHSVVSSPILTGGFALKAQSSAQLSTLYTGMSLSGGLAFRFMWMFAGNTNGAHSLFEERAPSNTNRLGLRSGGSASAPQLQLLDNAATLGLVTTLGPTILVANTWYLIECTFDPAAGGAIKVYLNGNLEISVTHTNDVSATPSGGMQISGDSINSWYFDDWCTASGGTTRIGYGRCIARQGTTGTPTDDAWTKNGQATAALCWSETPFNAANNCTSSTSGAAQTMPVAKFSVAGSTPEGSQVIGAGDTINAVKTAVVFKRATSGSPSIRRRVNGTVTDAVVTGATTDVYRDDGIWTTTVANLDLLEAGMKKAADANLTTAEDVWVMVDYTPAPLQASFAMAGAAATSFVGRSVIRAAFAIAGTAATSLVGRSIVRAGFAIAGISATSFVGVARTIVQATFAVAGAAVAAFAGLGLFAHGAAIGGYNRIGRRLGSHNIIGRVTGAARRGGSGRK